MCTKFLSAGKLHVLMKSEITHGRLPPLYSFIGGGSHDLLIYLYSDAANLSFGDVMIHNVHY